jgi:hypothetical protein
MFSSQWRSTFAPYTVARVQKISQASISSRGSPDRGKRNGHSKINIFIPAIEEYPIFTLLKDNSEKLDPAVAICNGLPMERQVDIQFNWNILCRLFPSAFLHPVCVYYEMIITKVSLEKF